MTSPALPPCFRPGQSQNKCYQAHFDRVVENKTPLHGEWTGWRMAGRDLVAPNGVRFRPGRLLAIAWAEKQAALKDRREAKTSGRAPKVMTLPARERFDGLA